MRGRQVILGRINDEEAAALIIDGQLDDLHFMADGALLPGTICRGIVDRLMKGQGGAFIRLPDGQRGYLRERSGLREGQPLLVQINGVPEDGKAFPLTSRLTLRGRYVLVTPASPGVNVSRQIRDAETRDQLTRLGDDALGGRDYGLILRSAAENAETADIRSELDALLGVADGILSEPSGDAELLLDPPTPWELAWTEWADPTPDAFEQGDQSFDLHGVTDLIEAFLKPEIRLPAGASAVIEPTRALIAVDVNTGQDSSPAASLKANLALARDLPRQLRLRGLGGQVVVDFAPMPKRDRVVLEQTLRSAFKRDSSEATLVGWTTMGLYEISRKRDRVPLRQLLSRSSVY